MSQNIKPSGNLADLQTTTQKNNKIEHSFTQDFNKQHNFESILRSIEKQTIINSYNFEDILANKNYLIYFYKLDLLFCELIRAGFKLSDKDKKEILIKKSNAAMLESIIRNELESYEDIKRNFDKNDNLVDDHFKEKEWVRIIENDADPMEMDQLVTGYVLQIMENDVYEILCKGKILKIHGSKILKMT